MKLSLWRSQFQSWLDKYIVVDSWALQNPADTATAMGFVPPLRDVVYENSDVNSVYLTGTQDFFVVKRYAGSYSYNELPIAAVEGAYATLAIRLLHNYQEINTDVIDLDLDRVSQPVKISETGEDNGDWQIEMMWSLRVKLEVDPETGAVQPPFTATQITANVYDTKLEEDFPGKPQPELRVLDFTLIRQ